LLSWQFVEATFEMLEPCFDFGQQLLTSLRQFVGKSAFKQRLPSLPALDPLLGLVQRKPARPWRERLRRIIRIKSFPQCDRGLLNYVFCVRHVRNQSRDITKDFPFAAQEQRKKPLLRSSSIS
jgi:hypothetical protein